MRYGERFAIISAMNTEFFKVDESKCLKCSLCVRDCAFKALKRTDDGRPAMAVPARCMRCQHCLAICPAGAISVDGKDPAEAKATASLELPSAAAVENYILSRRSMRHFKKENVDRAVLERILKTLGNVPTGCNARGLTFTCYPDMESMDAFRAGFIKAIEEHNTPGKLIPRSIAVPAIRMRKGGEDMFFRGASGLLIISSDETNSDVVTAPQDLAAACTYFEMLAQANSIATCWCGFLNIVQKEIPELLEKTSGIRRTTPFNAMLFGIPAVKYARTVLRGDYAKIDWR